MNVEVLKLLVDKCSEDFCEKFVLNFLQFYMSGLCKDEQAAKNLNNFFNGMNEKLFFDNEKQVIDD